MAEHFRTTRPKALKRGEWAEKFWEFGPRGAVTRTVETDARGQSRALSLQIMARKSGKFVNYARTADNPCLLQNHYASTADWQDALKDQGLHVQSITQDMFERRFMTSNPDL